MFGRSNIDDDDDDDDSVISDTSGADITVKLPSANDASSVVRSTHFGGEVDLLESKEEDNNNSNNNSNKESTTSKYSLVYNDTHLTMCPVRVVKTPNVRGGKVPTVKSPDVRGGKVPTSFVTITPREEVLGKEGKGASVAGKAITEKTVAKNIQKR